MTNWVAANRERHPIKTPIIDFLRERDRQAGKYDRTRRLRTLLGDFDGRDWPHKLMALTGRNFGGNWAPPHAPDLYIRVGPTRLDNRVAVPGTRNQKTITTKAMRAWDGVKRGEEWRTFDWQDDGYTLRVGWLGEDGQIHDSSIGGGFAGEMALFKKWFIWDSWIKYDWFGLRRKLYYVGLHAAVHDKDWFACQAVPAQNSGGYDHWHCQVPVGVIGTLRRRLGRPVRHFGPHVFRNMRWWNDGRVWNAVHGSSQD